MIIPLGHALPHTSSDRTRRHRASNPYPMLPHKREARHRLPIWSCSRWGLPSSRCHHRDWYALTAPFHPYQNTPCSGMPFHTGTWRSVFCGTFLRVAPTGRYPAPCSAEPGLSSPCQNGKARSSDLLCPTVNHPGHAGWEEVGDTDQQLSAGQSKMRLQWGHVTIVSCFLTSDTSCGRTRK